MENISADASSNVISSNDGKWMHIESIIDLENISSEINISKLSGQGLYSGTFAGLAGFESGTLTDLKTIRIYAESGACTVNNVGLELFIKSSNDLVLYSNGFDDSPGFKAVAEKITSDGRFLVTRSELVASNASISLRFADAIGSNLEAGIYKISYRVNPQGADFLNTLSGKTADGINNTDTELEIGEISSAKWVRRTANKKTNLLDEASVSSTWYTVENIIDIESRSKITIIKNETTGRGYGDIRSTQTINGGYYPVSLTNMIFNSNAIEGPGGSPKYDDLKIEYYRDKSGKMEISNDTFDWGDTQGKDGETDKAKSVYGKNYKYYLGIMPAGKYEISYDEYWEKSPSGKALVDALLLYNTDGDLVTTSSRGSLCSAYIKDSGQHGFIQGSGYPDVSVLGKATSGEWYNMDLELNLVDPLNKKYTFARTVSTAAGTVVGTDVREDVSGIEAQGVGDAITALSFQHFARNDLTQKVDNVKLTYIPEVPEPAAIYAIDYRGSNLLWEDGNYNTEISPDFEFFAVDFGVPISQDSLESKFELYNDNTGLQVEVSTAYVLGSVAVFGIGGKLEDETRYSFVANSGVAGAGISGEKSTIVARCNFETGKSGLDVKLVEIDSSEFKNTRLPGELAEVDISVDNGTNLSADCAVVVSYYAGKKMIYCDVKDYGSIAKFTAFNDTAQFVLPDNFAETTMVKIFVWDSLNPTIIYNTPVVVNTAE